MFQSFNPDELTNVYEGATTATPLDGFTYNNDGTLLSRTEGTGVSSAAYSWDGIGRLTAQSDTIAGTNGNVGWSFTLNPASQIATEARTETNNAYAYSPVANVTRAYAVNGLNQYTSAGTASLTYDANGNLTSDGAAAYVFDVENRLVKATIDNEATNLVYDPLGRLFQTDQGSNATTTRFLYDGDALISEHNSSNALTARYVHGSNAAADDPLVWYTGTGSATKRWLHADHLGSIVGVTNSSGSGLYKNAYDDYGIPGSANTGRFQYTGQAWLSELGMYYYKARIYSPTLGRFLQTDPIGYKDQINLYAYVGNDPANGTDPSGMDSIWLASDQGRTTVIIPVRFSGNGATPDAISRVVARAAALDTGDPNLKIQIVPTDRPLLGTLNKMNFSSGFDFKNYRAVGEGVNKVGGNRGHINSDSADSAGNFRDPEGALLHDILHMAGYREGYEGGQGDGEGGRTRSTPIAGLTGANIMASRSGNSLTPQQSEEASKNRSSKQCSIELGSRIPVCN